MCDENERYIYGINVKLKDTSVGEKAKRWSTRPISINSSVNICISQSETEYAEVSLTCHKRRVDEPGNE